MTRPKRASAVRPASSGGAKRLISHAMYTCGCQLPSQTSRPNLKSSLDLAAPVKEGTCMPMRALGTLGGDGIADCNSSAGYPFVGA